jgi:hypothetical protein
MRTTAHRLGIAAVSFFALHCSSGSGAPKTSTTQPNGASIAPPSVGVQLASTSVTLAASSEKYLCWSSLLPSAFSVIGTETGIQGAGVHHYAVFTSSADLPASPDAYDCSNMDASWGLVSGGGRDTPGFDFPQGVGMPLPAGQHIVFQLHLLNSTGASLTLPVQALNLNGSTATGLQTAGLVVAGNLDLSIPPLSSNVQISGGCATPFALQNVFAVFPHMHQLGTHIAMTITKQAPTTTQTLIDESWDFGNQGVYAAAGAAAAGDQVTVTCTYDNPTNATVTFGESSADEMCLGVLYYYPATQPSAYCGF